MVIVSSASCTKIAPALTSINANIRIANRALCWTGLPNLLAVSLLNINPPYDGAAKKVTVLDFTRLEGCNAVCLRAALTRRFRARRARITAAYRRECGQGAIEFSRGTRRRQPGCKPSFNRHVPRIRSG